MSEFLKAAQQSEIPTGTIKVVSVAGKQIALCHAEDGFFAVADLCTHDNGPLGEGELIDGQIECPRHGARFDIKTGQALCLPAVVAVPTYKVELRGEEIWVGSTPTEEQN
jgi:3-phenylpropionate/trans-cinnamate dioxygenase ferredoxin component